MLIRDARPEDAAPLAELAVMAGHGVLELLYDGLLPGRSFIETIVERRLLRTGDTAELRRWRVAIGPDGQIKSATNAMPHDELMACLADPLIGSGRSDLLAEVGELEARCSGSLYVNILAVFPEHRGHGIGRRLIEDAEAEARRRGHMALSLVTFDSDWSLIAFYRSNGFRIDQCLAVRPHRALSFGGNWALMVKRLAPPIIPPAPKD